MTEQNTTAQKILIIEDDKFLRDLIQQKLTKEGFLTVVASDGEEGVRAAQSEIPHLVLLDLMNLPSFSLRSDAPGR